MKAIRYGLWGVLLVLGAGYFAAQIIKDGGTEGRSEVAVVPLAPKGDARPFDLLSHTGDRLTGDDLLGKYRLMYFGYTFCPDKCPLDLAKMTLVLGKLEDQGVPLDSLQPLFISIDPERDTADVMADTVSLYHKKLIGLTGTADEIAKVAGDYGIYYRKLEQAGLDSYLMDHMVAIFLYSPDGRFMTMFTPTENADQIVNTLKPLLEAQQS